MKFKKTLEDQINEFLNYWECKDLCAFLRDTLPLFELYDVEDENDWVKDAVGKDNERNVRLIRTVYLISRIAEIHAGKLAYIKSYFKDIYKKIEREACQVNAINAVSTA